MSNRIFIWVAHPNPSSLCSAIADRYERAAEAAGAEVARMDLAHMMFDTSEPGTTKQAATLEPDLKTWQENVAWADHVFIVHPYWWGAMPAKAKAVLDRALTSGFGYKYKARGVAWEKLLKGRTGDAIITSDTPPWIDWLIYRMPGRRVLKNQVFAFCGIKPRKLRQFGSVKLADERKIAKWLGEAETMGRSAAAA